MRLPNVLSIVLLLATLAFGLALGLAGFTFVYAQGASYLSNDPAACANCHVMQEQFDAWGRSSHHAVAGCNDCHTPANFVGKYLTKASNGYHHSLAFTLGNFHEPIQIKERNRQITEASCRHCHQPIIEQIDAHAGTGAMSCVRCHRSVGHMH